MIQINYESINRLLKKWNIKPSWFEYIKEGRANTNILVKENTNKYVLKIFTLGYKTPKETKTEIDFLLHLKKCHIPVPEIVKDGNNNYINTIEINNQPYDAILMKYIEGTHIKSYDHNNVVKIGRELALMHIASQKYHYNNLFVTTKDKTFKKIDLSKINNPITKEFLSKAIEFEITIDEAPKGFVHDDINKSNLLFKDNELVGILDFDDMKYSYLTQDVGGFLLNLFFNIENKKLDANIISTFLTAYEKTRPLSKPEKKSLKQFVMLRNYNFGVFEFTQDNDEQGGILDYIAISKKIEESELLSFS